MPRRSPRIAVLGSGFAGSLCALILNRLGHDVLVIDRARHPRFAIGESSTPTANLALLALCDRYGLPAIRPLAKYGSWQARYPQIAGGRKRGFSYFQHTPGRPFEPDPAHGNELLVAASPDDLQSDTQWFRADVDAFFADQVREAGIPIWEDTSLLAATPGARWRLEVVRDGRTVDLDAAFVIDATGPGGALAQALHLPDERDLLHTQSRALYTHVEGLPTWASQLARAGASLQDHPFACDDAALHHLLEAGWMWWIRFNNGLTSAGFVLDTRSAPAESDWASLLAPYPSLDAGFAEARLADRPGAVVQTGRLQRLSARIAGDTWALLPHAAGFVDPLHSTGIAHTLLGIERLMRIFERSWGRPALPAKLAGYAASVREELRHVDRIVDAGYAAMGDFRLFTATTMLYFAAAIAYEERRIKAGVEDDLLLMANDPGLRGIVANFHRSLREAGPRDVPAIEAAIEAAIRPYNTAGLFAPAAPNMYAYTAATF
ncbi:MAG: tryptophan 7-halogenase [Rhodothermales bacterium]